MFDDLERY